MGSFPHTTAMVLCLVLSAVCTNMTILFPFVPFLVRDLGMVEDPRKPGFCARPKQPHPPVTTTHP